MKTKAAFFGNTATTQNVYGQERIEQLNKLADFYPEVITNENFDEKAAELKDIEVIFSTWGMLALTPEQIELLPKLKAVFYSAGSVKFFARPFLEKGIKVTSAVAANAIPVAEFCLAQILLSCKRFFSNVSETRKDGKFRRDTTGKGVYGETIALIGVGEITRYLLMLLKPFNLKILAVSNHLAQHPEKAEALGIDEVVSIEDAFKRAYIVSNHLPNLDSNKNIINKKLLSSMRENATFINTGRGAQVDEGALVEVMNNRPDLTALLDVTEPEPPVEGSPLYTTPNIYLSTHIAGSLNDEVHRMADYMIEEFKRFDAGDELLYGIDLDLFDKLA